MFRSLLPLARTDLTRTDDPFTSLQRQMNRLFEDTFSNYAPVGRAGTGAALSPSIDIKETDTAIEVEAELPGVDEKDVQVTLDDGVLTIKGEKKAEKEETKKGYYMSERSYGSFLRSFELPAGIDADKVQATFAKGVLKVALPKPVGAQAKAKKIEIKAA
jgi:HSP20 family protein